MEHTRFIWWRRKYISNFWFRIWHLCLFWLQLFWKIVNKKRLDLSALFMEHTHSSFPTSINYLLLTCKVRLRYRRCSSRHEFPNENVLITTFLQGWASIQTRTVSQSFIWFCINFQDNHLQHFQKRKMPHSQHLQLFCSMFTGITDFPNRSIWGRRKYKSIV